MPDVSSDRSVRPGWDAIIAHQLKTPLCAMDAKLSSTDTVDRARLRQDIRRLTRLIDQLQLVARCRDDGVERREPVLLGTAVRDIVSELAPIAFDARLSMMFRNFGPDCAIQGDPILIGEAIRNVIENAVKYSPPGGTIVVVVTARGRVYVLDRGPGVAASDTEAVFEPFRRGVTQKPGSGLGLFLVREIMRRENGTATILMRRGGGSAAFLRFERV